MANKNIIGKLNKRILIEEEDRYTKDLINGYTNAWIPFYNQQDNAEVGTTTTNIKMTNHELITGDYIINTTRSNAVRQITKVDANNITVSAISGQTQGDIIQKRFLNKSVVWANMIPQITKSYGDKLFTDNKFEVISTHVIKTRYRQDIKSHYRIRLLPDLARVFNISSFIIIEEKQKFIELKVKEVIT